MPWLGKLGARKPPYHTARAMIGVKPGDRVLVIGADNGGLAAELALVTGLNGRTLVADAAAEAQARVEAAAASAGALVETLQAPATQLSLEDAGFDIVVVQQELAARPDAAPQIIAEAVRMSRPGGRVLVVERTKRAGLLGALTRPASPPIDSGAIREWLIGAGLRAARVLAEAEGAVFVEGVKPRV